MCTFPWQKISLRNIKHINTADLSTHISFYSKHPPQMSWWPPLLYPPYHPWHPENPHPLWITPELRHLKTTDSWLKRLSKKIGLTVHNQMCLGHFHHYTNSNTHHCKIFISTPVSSSTAINKVLSLTVIHLLQPLEQLVSFTLSLTCNYN